MDKISFFLSNTQKDEDFLGSEHIKLFSHL